jgi:hypothetical integral membrane protein (TIGR02206 family)
MQPPAATPPPPGYDCLTDFVPFTAMHLLTVALLTAAMLGSCWMGRLWRGSQRERTLRHTWGWFVVLVAVVSNIYYFVPVNWDIRDSLPLQLCDLAIFVAAAAMLLDSRFFRTLLYFWGIGLSTQAFITPTLQFGIGHPKFWLFWIGHTCIVGSAIYDIVVGGYRPRLRDVLVAAGSTVAYLIVMLIVNEGIDRLWPNPDRFSNYGYVGRGTPKNPTIIDRLGDWPARLAPLALIVFADYALLWGIWPIARKITGRKNPIQAVRARCATCEYDLAGLPQPPATCPECGTPLPKVDEPIRTNQ